MTDVEQQQRRPAAREKAAKTREIGRCLYQLTVAAELVAKRASAIELHAAKNTAAGYDKGARNKLGRAADLRRLAAFLADHRLHEFIRGDERILELLMGEPPKPRPGARDYMKPRTIAPAEVTPTKNSSGWSNGCWAREVD